MKGNKGGKRRKGRKDQGKNRNKAFFKKDRKGVKGREGEQKKEEAKIYHVQVQMPYDKIKYRYTDIQQKNNFRGQSHTYHEHL